MNELINEFYYTKQKCKKEIKEDIQAIRNSFRFWSENNEVGSKNIEKYSVNDVQFFLLHKKTREIVKCVYNYFFYTQLCSQTKNYSISFKDTTKRNSNKMHSYCRKIMNTI